MNIYLLLFLEFFKIGLFCFGGAFGMLPLIEETCLKHSWVSESEFYNFVGIAESTPGPIAVNMATYVGNVKGGAIGSLCASFGVVLPSFLIILLIASVLKSFTSNKYFKGFLKGVKPVVIALIISTGATLLATTLGFSDYLNLNFDSLSAIIFALLILIYFVFKKLFKRKMSSILLILISAFFGILLSVISEMTA